MSADETGLLDWLRVDLLIWPALLAIGWMIASRRFTWWRGRATRTIPARAEVRRMGPAEEMQKLAAVVGRAIEQAGRMAGAQAAAERQIDAAEHAYRQLLAELEGVMAVRRPLPVLAARAMPPTPRALALAA